MRAAALVLVGGLMWPTGEEDSAATERVGEVIPAVTPTSAPDAAPERDVETSEAPDAMIDGSAEQRAAALLTTVLECGRRGDAVCADAVVDGAGAAVQERLAGTEAKRTIAAVEDYGDVGVLRLGESGQRGEQMLVLVMQKDRWLVRDVYDVANQPSGQG